MKQILIIITTLFLAGCASAGPQESQKQLRLVRDNYGVPHIYADDVYGLYYGYGYAVAQDRLFQMEMTRRSTQGTVAEVLGAEYLDYDQGTRKLFDPASIHRQLNALADEDRGVFAGFAAGMNAWLAEIRSNAGELMPKQFIDNEFEPDNWTAYDVVMIFVGTMSNRYGDFNTELDNLKIQQSLIAQHGEIRGRLLFDLLNPRFTDNAPTTIPREDWSVPVPDNLAGTSQDMAAPANYLANYPDFIAPVTTGMSNCYVIGRDKVDGANSILVNGPQFGWFSPAYVYSVGMHGAGIDVVGNTPFAYPMIMFGHNKSITWGSTWAAGDIVDIYAEQLNPDKPAQYLYQGKYRDLQHRVEVIRVRGSETINLDVYRSVHGPIIHEDLDAGIVYAKHRAWDGRELETLLAWLAATHAGDFESWKGEAAKSAINVNMYFADVYGNIGYFFGGQYPQRVAGHDNRFPVTGDGSMDWLARLPVELANPHVKNPASGFLANWNNKPGQGVMNPDFFFFSWSEADRVDILNHALDRSDTFTAEQAWALLTTSSYTDVHAPYLLPLIDKAMQEQDDERLKTANGILQSWDWQSLDSDQDGNYDGAATAIFRSFAGVLLNNVLGDDLGDAFGPFSATGYPTADKPTAAGTNIQTGMKAVIESLSGRGEYDLLNGEKTSTVIVQSLSQTLDLLAVEQGSDLTAYRLPVAKRPFSNVNFLGIPQAGSDELMILPIEQNRGTENNMMIMQENAIVGWEVTPPGQNAFVSPSGEKGAHYDDQFEMYNSFGRKRMWFYAEDVEANKVSEEVVSYKP
jgi:penicillin amidase